MLKQGAFPGVEWHHEPMPAEARTLPLIEAAAMYTDQGMYNASGFGTPEELPATITNHNLFRVLGVEPFIGSTGAAAARAGRAWA